MSTDEFDDIRPYRDDEVVSVLRQLSTNSEFIGVLAGIIMPKVKSRAPWLASFMVRQAVKRKFRSITTVHDFQMLIGDRLEELLLTAADGCTCTGIERLNPHQAYLFISNHRDIAMDPAMVNLMLHRQGMDTVRIAIGDNLLSKPYTSDLMRINKSFIVKRSAQGRREKLQSLIQLSRYIRHSITVDGQSVWIAQREGRAKDGIDKTETALLKMLGLSAAKSLSLAEGISELNIVPVSISYELDPCDSDKGKELHALRSEGGYQKLEHEDLASIYKGIVGYKGRVHVAFGEPIGPDVESVDQLTALIDREIIANYQLQPTNILAYEMLTGSDDYSEHWRRQLNDRDWSRITQLFQDRIAGMPEHYRDIVLAMYANPVKQKQKQLA